MDKRKEILLDALKNEDEQVKKAAAEALEMLQARGRLADLAGQIESGDMLEKINTIYAVAALKGQGVTAILAKALKDPSEDVRAAAARALGESWDNSVLQPLVESLGDASPMVVRSVLKALESFRDPRLLKPLMQVLKNPDAGVVELAVEAIGRLGDKRSEEAMLYFAVKGNKRMKELAIKALGVMDS